MVMGSAPEPLGSSAVSGPDPLLWIMEILTVSPTQQLSNELGPGKKVLVVGGGFLGSELAYAMTQTG